MFKIKTFDNSGKTLKWTKKYEKFEKSDFLTFFEFFKSNIAVSKKNAKTLFRSNNATFDAIFCEIYDTFNRFLKCVFVFK